MGYVRAAAWRAGSGGGAGLGRGVRADEVMIGMNVYVGALT